MAASERTSPKQARLIFPIHRENRARSLSLQRSHVGTTGLRSNDIVFEGPADERCRVSLPRYPRDRLPHWTAPAD